DVCSSDLTRDQRLVIGVDFGTLSGRAVVVRVSDGEEIGSAEHAYTHAVMERELTAGDGRRLPPEWALQAPADYVDVLRRAVPAALENAGADPTDVVGIGTDFPACTMVPTLAVGRYGGLISSEWEFAKGLQMLEEDPELYGVMDRWVEAADWIVWQLCGTYVRNACTAGYKGIYQEGKYPSPEFLHALNPDFEGFVRDKLDQPIAQLGQSAGRLTEEAAAWTGLPAGIAVAVGNVDAHVTVPAAGAVEPGQMVAIMGTSTCHVMNGDQLAEVP